MAVVEPRARGVLDPLDTEGFGRTDRPRVARPVGGDPAVSVDVEGVEVGADRHHVPLHALPHLRPEDGRVADERAPVDRHEVLSHVGEDDLELAVGGSLMAAEDGEHPVHAALERVLHRRRVVVVRPHAGRIVAGLQHVRVRVTRQHIRIPAGEAGQEGAVGARGVADAVEVHRVGVMPQRVHVLEVDADRVAHARLEQRARDEKPVRARLRRVRLRLLPVRAVTAIDDSLDHGLRRRHRLAHDRVAAVRRDVPRDRHRGDPVVDRPRAARAPLRRRVDPDCAAEGDDARYRERRRSPTAPKGISQVTSTSACIHGWMRQMM